MPKSSPPKKGKLRPNTKVNLMTFLFTILSIVPPSTPSQSAQCIRSRNRKRNNSAWSKHSVVSNGTVRNIHVTEEDEEVILPKKEILTIYGGTATLASKTKLKQV